MGYHKDYDKIDGAIGQLKKLIKEESFKELKYYTKESANKALELLGAYQFGLLKTDVVEAKAASYDWVCPICKTEWTAKHIDKYTKTCSVCQQTFEFVLVHQESEE